MEEIPSNLWFFVDHLGLEKAHSQLISWKKTALGKNISLLVYLLLQGSQDRVNRMAFITTLFREKISRPILLKGISLNTTRFMETSTEHISLQ
jgi:hypothetical protein